MKKGEYNPKEHAEILYNMELHEVIMFSDELSVCHVPGGWIYYYCQTSVFVPWNNTYSLYGMNQ